MTDWRYVFIADFGVRSYQVKITFDTGFTARISTEPTINCTAKAINSLYL